MNNMQHTSGAVETLEKNTSDMHFHCNKCNTQVKNILQHAEDINATSINIYCNICRQRCNIGTYTLQHDQNIHATFVNNDCNICEQ
jgi:transcription elongation factor Elf1